MRKVARKLARAFSGLKVRYKLMILHNLFFLILAVTAWFSLIPLLEREAARSLERELSLAREAGRPAGEIRDYYEAFTRKAEITLFLVLAGIYALGVLLLELFVMPVYIYRPLRQLLEADEASRRGDTERELISEELIQGDELGQLMASRNATLRKLRQHEQDLQNALAQLEQTANDLRRKNYLLETAKRNIADQDRLASLGLLSASVAHELNTPLAVLRGSIEKLLETVDDAAAQERLERMLRVTQRLQRLSEGLLDFARVRKQEMEPVAVRPLLEEAWSLVAIDEKAATVRFTNETEESDWVRGNSDRLMQLFVNLLRNALYAVPRGGQIRVSSRREADFVTVSVEDDGPGIPPGVLPEIFEAFVTTRLDARGTGLGLTVAEGIAHQHGGSIVAANRPEGGACLEVRLPAAQPEAARR
jgi:signal transduction histidine kinase